MTVDSVKLATMDTIRYRISPYVCFSTDKDGTAILNVEHGKFHSLIGAGNSAWQQIATQPQGVTLDSIVKELMVKEDELANKERENVEQTVTQMLDTLANNGLVETSERPSSCIYSGARRSVCTTTAELARHLTNTLVKWHQPRLSALLMFAMFQIIRWIGSFPARYHTIKNWPIDSHRTLKDEGVAQICVAIDEAATWYPKESLCLQRAAVTTCLLRQHGIPAEMKIGIHKLPFAGHAWVEIGGNVVNDHKGVQRYFKVIDVW